MPVSNGLIDDANLGAKSVGTRQMQDDITFATIRATNAVFQGATNWIALVGGDGTAGATFGTGSDSETDHGALYAVEQTEGASTALRTILNSPSFATGLGDVYMILQTETADDSTKPPHVTFGYSGSSTQTPVFVLESQMELSVYSAYATTTATAANLFVENGAGDGLAYTFKRSTSSERYKSNIETVDLADVTLRPVSFTSDADNDVRMVGFIAEEIAEQIPEAAILGDDGQVENYDIRAVVAALASKINKLEQRMEGCNCGLDDT